MRKYKLIISDNFSRGREYIVNSRNVIKLAYEYGRGTSGEEISVTTMSDKPLSCAVWHPAYCKYIRVAL